MPKYKIYRELKDHIFTERQGESYCLIREDITECDTVQEAVSKIIDICLNSNHSVNEFRIMQEVEVDVSIKFVVSGSKCKES